MTEFCAICDTQLGFYNDENGKRQYTMKCNIDNMLDPNFKSYDCCGLCALDRMKQKTFEKLNNK